MEQVCTKINDSGLFYFFFLCYNFCCRLHFICIRFCMLQVCMNAGMPACMQSLSNIDRNGFVGNLSMFFQLYIHNFFLSCMSIQTNKTRKNYIYQMIIMNCNDILIQFLFLFIFFFDYSSFTCCKEKKNMHMFA